MSSGLNPALIADLARLARRYPAGDWEALITFLNDESKRGQVVSLLQELSEASRRTRSAKVGVARTSISRVLEDLAGSDPQKAELLRDLRVRLVTGELFPRLSDLRAFAGALGLEDLPSAKKREQNVGYLLRSLAALPYEHIAQALAGTSQGLRDLGGEYQRWVQFILARDPGREGAS